MSRPATIIERQEALGQAHSLDGITKTDCAYDCRPDFCVITHKNYCGHPAKGAAAPRTDGTRPSWRAGGRVAQVVVGGEAQAAH